MCCPSLRRAKESVLQRAGAYLLAASLLALAPGSIARAESARVSVAAIPDEVWSYMQGRSWRPGRGCPERSELALLRVPYRDFEGRTQLGPMIVAKKVASKIAAIFQEIYDGGAFRIYRIGLVDDYGG
ncbi:MAG TPA: M15 family peptidase, partial [Methylocystis sp.]|nr:M15 family peptidase [Methylocystis sp.]